MNISHHSVWDGLKPDIDQLFSFGPLADGGVCSLWSVETARLTASK